MSHIWIAMLIIVGRIVSFFVGCASLYVGFFLYEDQEGAIQNRLEEIWVGIHERARQRGVAGVALLNSSAGRVDALINRLFGENIFSAQSVMASACLSNLGVVIAILKTHHTAPSQFGRTLIGLAVLAGTSLWGVLNSKIYADATRRTNAFMAFAMTLATSCICGLLISDSVAIHPHNSHEFFASARVGIVPVTLSLFSDLVLVAVVREVNRFLARGLSLGRLVAALSVLIAIPAQTAIIIAWNRRDIHLLGMRGFIFLIGLMNITTAIISLIPIAFIVVLLIHLLIWPVLSRVLYPVARHGIVGSRKTLSALGVLALIFAFNLEAIGIRGILKLFG